MIKNIILAAATAITLAGSGTAASAADRETVDTVKDKKIAGTIGDDTSASNKERLALKLDSGGVVVRTIQDTLQRQHQAQAQAQANLLDRRWLTLQSASREVGTFDGEIGLDGQHSAESGPFNESDGLGLHALGGYKLTSSLTLGASLSYLNGRDRLENWGKLDNVS